MTRLDRYLLREILVPFLFSLAFVVLIVFLFQVRRLAQAAVGIACTAADALLIFLSALPPFLVLAVPIGYLLSVMIGLSRLTADREITAMRGAGLGPFRIARVPLVLGALVSAACFPIAYWGEPHGLRLLYDRLVDVGLRNISSAIQPGVFNETFAGVALYAGGRGEGGDLQDVLLFDEREASQPIIVVASRGELRPEGKSSIVVGLEDGEMHLGDAAGTRPGGGARYDRVRFERARLGIDTQNELGSRTRFVSGINRLTSEEMLEQVARAGPHDRYGRRVDKTYWRRFAFPAMAFVFGAVAVAIALSSGGFASRVPKALIALLAIVGYYVLTRVGDYAVVQWPHTPLAAAFGPNLLVLGLAIAAIARSARPR